MRLRFIVTTEYPSVRLEGQTIVQGRVMVEAGKQYEAFKYESIGDGKAYIIFNDGFTIEAVEGDFELSGPAAQQPSPTCCKGR